MSVENTRFGIAALNVTLTAGLAFLGYYTFLKHHVPAPGDCVPAYRPTEHQLPMVTNRGDPLKDFKVVWDGLDKPADPPPVVKPVEKPVVPDDLSAKFKLVLVAIDPEDPKLNNCIIEKKDQGTPGDNQQAFRVGETLFAPFEAFKVVKVEARQDTKGPRTAVLTIEDTKKTLPNGSHPVTTIVLTPAAE